MSDSEIFRSDCAVTPDDRLIVDTDDSMVNNLFFNAYGDDYACICLRRSSVEKLRDALTQWLDRQPEQVKP